VQADTTLRRLHTSLLLYQYPLVASQLLDICGDVDHIYAYLEAKKISEVKLPSKLKKVLKVNHRSRNQDHLNHIIAWLNLPDRTFICLDSADYPTQLAEISDPPLVLYAHGNLELLKQPQLAIVGSRNPTQYGRAVTKLFAEEIGKSGLVVTSGMARGIDSAAHRGTLGVGGNTIAVLGTGCDHVYPPENQTLMHEIASSGLLLSEFPPGIGPAPTHFPQRNRIVTGMSCGTIVVEARLRSGSLISARLAMEQGRGVFAVPGSVLSKQSEGCHHLLKEGAQLAGSVADVIEELCLSYPDLRVHQNTGPVLKPTSLNQRQQNVLEAIDLEPRSVDSVVKQTGMVTAEVLQTLVELELVGFVSSVAGCYQLCSDWSRD
jgi:DNA processing protein